MTRTRYALISLACVVLSGVTYAGDRVLGAGGVSTIEGAGGGGLVPWATITGTGSANQVGGVAFATRVQFPSAYRLDVAGVALGLGERFELSAARWSFDLADVVPGQGAEMNVFGAKLSLFGHALYDQDRVWPQTSFGVQYKETSDKALVRQLGAQDTSGADFYLTASKFWLSAIGGRNLITNAAVRRTHANQFGLLGFGGPRGVKKSIRLETSIGLMLRDDLVLGAEWRQRPNNLEVDDATRAYRENGARDVFLAWLPCRGGSITAAWVDLGNIVTKERQRGWYLSGQWNY